MLSGFFGRVEFNGCWICIPTHELGPSTDFGSDDLDLIKSECKLQD